MASIGATANVTITANAHATDNHGSATANVTVTATANALNPRATANVAVTSSGIVDVIVSTSKMFTFVQSIQNIEGTTTFKFIQTIEQPETVKTIRRVHV